MADADYLIEISAAMPDGAATAAELDALVDKLNGATKRSDQFSAAVARVTADLEAAKAASTQAAAALAAGNEQYGLLERSAVQTAKALEKAQAKGQFNPRAALAAHEAQTALDAYTGTLRGLEDAAASAKGKHDGLARTLANLNKVGNHAESRARAMNERYEKLGAVVARLPGPLASVGGQLLNTAKGANGLSLAFSGAEAAMIATVAASVAVVAAIVAVTVAVVAGAVAFTRYAVTQADAARQADLSREAFAALSAETAAGASAFDAVSDATGLADAELRALTKQLKAAEVSASEMPAALRAAALAERALGSGGASEFIERIKSGETSVKAFAQEVEDKFGGIVAEQLRGIDAQLARGAKLWRGLFKGIDLDPFLDALTVLVGMFDKANPLAQAFGAAVESAVGAVAPLALEAAYAVEAFALEFAIQLTKMYLAVKPAIKWLGELFGFGSDGQGTALIDTLAALGKVAAVLAVVFGGALVVAVGAVAGMIASLALPFVVLGTVIYGAVTAAWDFLTGLYALGAAIVNWATTAGVDLMMGLIEGVKSAVGAVVTAVSDAVGSAITAAKDVLGIHSPSTVFAEIGTNTAEGFTQGVEAGTPEAQGSMAAMVGPDAARSGAGASVAAAAPTRGGGNFSGATFNFYGVKDAEHARDLISEALTQLFEDDADSLGGAAPA